MNNMSYGIAIDIGTTTICAALVRSYDGGVLREVSRLNCGRMFGADVISRIKAASDGSLLMLQDCMRSDLTAVLAAIVTPEVASGIDRIVIAGNTTMLHILRGYSCVGLGRYPYTAVTLEPEVLALREVLPRVTFLGDRVEVVLFPGFTAFVGADILAGVYYLTGENSVTQGESWGTGTLTHFSTPDKLLSIATEKRVSVPVPADSPLVHFLLLDLGTNGEMALVERGSAGARRITVCSTAAGPVFEGGGIRCGMGGVDGAIAHVRIGDNWGRFCLSPCSAGDNTEPSPLSPAAVPLTHSLDVIGGGRPLGLCGTGVMETVAELRRAGIIDETGLMQDPYFEEGFPLVAAEESGTGAPILFTQDDVRAVQMAKAAIRAGIETLLKAAGLSPEGIDAVYVAGGYGQHMDFDAIRALDMIPEALLAKCRAAGNTSLAGCIRLLEALALADDGAGILAELRALSLDKKEVVLADEDGFEERYYDSMGM